MIGVPLEETRKAAGEWAREFDASFPVLFDPEQRIARAYNVEAIPHSVVIDREGRIAAIISGADLEALEAAVRQAAGT